jgi:hypothetical protein
MLGLTSYQQFCLNLTHHGGEVDTGVVHAFVDMMRSGGFELRSRRTTLTFAQNGHLIITRRRLTPKGTVVIFRHRGQKAPIITIPFGRILDLARGGGNRLQRLKETHAALRKIVRKLSEAVAAR